MEERGGKLIGVDTDWTVSAPDYADIVLTSVLKKMDVAVFDTIQSVVDGTFEGGTYLGTFENDGVGLAPFHSFEDDVRGELKKRSPRCSSRWPARSGPAGVRAPVMAPVWASDAPHGAPLRCIATQRTV